MNTLGRTEPLVNENFFYNSGYNHALEKKVSSSCSFKSILKKRRNFQILPEVTVSNIGEGFALNVFAFGKSMRLSGTESGKPGLITGFVTRFTPGDFFDEKRKEVNNLYNREKNGCVKQR